MTDGPFDAAASIEMGEHVGESNYPTYAPILHRCVRPGGRVLIQQMSRRGSHPGGGPFIESFIAPDMHCARSARPSRCWKKPAWRRSPSRRCVNTMCAPATRGSASRKPFGRRGRADRRGSRPGLATLLGGGTARVRAGPDGRRPDSARPLTWQVDELTPKGRATESHRSAPPALVDAGRLTGSDVVRQRLHQRRRLPIPALIGSATPAWWKRLCWRRCPASA